MTAIHPALGRLKADADLLAPHLRAAVEELPGEARRIAGYHFGWLDERGDPATVSAGKGIRGSLALASAQAVGANRRSAIPAAVALELVHNFSLMQDDFMDGDHLR